MVDHDGDFYSIWEEWVSTYNRENKALEQRLASTYREAWKVGNSDDRYAVLYFVFATRDEQGFDLIREALRADEGLALDAIAITSALLHDGYSLGANLAKHLGTLTRKYPDSSLLETALDLSQREADS